MYKGLLEKLIYKISIYFVHKFMHIIYLCNINFFMYYKMLLYCVMINKHIYQKKCLRAFCIYNCVSIFIYLNVFINKGSSKVST